jgi:hypothetical protein
MNCEAPSHNTVPAIKLRRISWTVHVACLGEMRITFIILVRKSQS